MSNLFDQELTLPGVVTEILSDYNSGYDTSSWGTTDEVCIIGTAFNGPVGKEVKIYSPEHARYVFGSVYDSTSRKEATLVANIQDAWDRGCRSIIAVRVSGKNVYKDYQFAIDTSLKLRVSGIFPSNSNKDLAMVYEDSSEDLSVTIYKPAERATINEKKFGLVESANSVLENKIEIYDGGLTKDDDFIQLIERVNNNPYNNVIRLSIVDNDGNDVTRSSQEAKTIKIGDMFPGIYTVGRNANSESVVADTKLGIVMDAKPYESFEGSFYKVLELNTNVSVDLPIYSANGDLQKYLGISEVNQYDFLKVLGKIDDVFIKDKVDYEQVDIPDFELYKLLGSGFAINAQIIEKNGKFKVKEVTDRKNKKSEIADGIYSMLENLKCKYRVLAGVPAESKIKGVLPKASAFRVAKANSGLLFNRAVQATPIIKEDDLTEPKQYKISFKKMDETLVDELNRVKKSLFTDKTIRSVTLMSADEFTKERTATKRSEKKIYKEGSLFLVTDYQDSDYAEKVNLLFIFSNGKFTCLHQFHDATTPDLMENQLIYANGAIYKCSGKQTKVDSNSSLQTLTFVPALMNDFMQSDDKKSDKVQKTYAMMSLENGTFVIVKINQPVNIEEEGVVASSANVTGQILGTVNSILDPEDDEDRIIFSLSDSYNTNEIIVRSNEFDYLTIEEIVDKLNADKDFSKILTLKCLDNTKCQDFLDDIKDDANVNLEVSIIDKNITYDTNKLIPFRTDDFFARQLAQHCMYTSMKTSPTHGIMGTRILLDTSLNSISNRVEDLVSLRLDSQMVGKKGNGTDLLDRNNMPYPIGRKVSIIVGQYEVQTNDNYVYVSNMAAGYAGMVSGLPLDQSSTCQPIDIPDLSYSFTNYQLSALTNAGFVTIKKSYSKGWVITDGITMATAESAYRRLSASRIGDGIETIIRKICEPYIGKQNNLTNQNSLTSAIKSGLDKVKGTLIEDYDFDLIIDKADARLGIINIDFRIVPIYEIKQIRNSISVGDNK